MRSSTWGSLGVALSVAALLGCVASPAGAQAKNAPAPTGFSATVKGLTADSGKAISDALKKNDAVGNVAVNAGEGTLTLQVKAEKTLKLSDVAKAVADASSKDKPLDLQKGDIALLGSVEVKVTGKADATAVAAALKGAPNVGEVKANKDTFTVTITGSKGTKVSEINDALAKVKVAKEGDAPPSIDDVAWTAPKAAAGGGGHG